MDGGFNFVTCQPVAEERSRARDWVWNLAERRYGRAYQRVEAIDRAAGVIAYSSHPGVFIPPGPPGVGV